MGFDPTKIAEARKAQRASTAKPEDRKADALEQIADTLEAIRIDLASWLSTPDRSPQG